MDIGITYQMYSAMILLVNGLVSKLSRSSNRDTVPLSDLRAKTLNEELLFAVGLLEFGKREFHILVFTVCQD